MSDGLARLVQWFGAHCDGDWEHGEGIRIETLDNPGWWLRIDLRGTELEDAPFDPITRGTQTETYISPDMTDWLACHVREQVFEGFGGWSNLDDLVQIFADWATNARTS